MYSALEVSKYVIDRCNKNGHPMSNLQLQKILYYIQGYYLACFNKPLFKDAIVAWRLGPTIPSVFEHYKYWGYDPILRP